MNHQQRRNRFGSHRGNARRRGIAWDLSFAELDRLYATTPQTCFLCDLPFNADRVMTVDRIDPRCGYVLGNVRILCHRCKRRGIEMPDRVKADRTKTDHTKVFKRRTKTDHTKVFKRRIKHICTLCKLQAIFSADVAGFPHACAETPRTKGRRVLVEERGRWEVVRAEVA